MPTMMSASAYAKRATAKFGTPIHRKAIARACSRGLRGARKNPVGGWLINPALADDDLLNHLPRIAQNASMADFQREFARIMFQEAAR